MSQLELLIRVVALLNRLGIDYMLTGSMASSLQGEPRSTHDVDLVVALQTQDADLLIDAFPTSNFYLSPTAVREGIQKQTTFNLISYATGDKVDFWPLTDEPFDRSRFARKMKQSAFGVELVVSSPEDTILAKLRWDKLCGGSAKQFHDVRGILALQGELLDRAYLDHWAKELDVVERWNEASSGI